MHRALARALRRESVTGVAGARRAGRIRPGWSRRLVKVAPHVASSRRRVVAAAGEEAHLCRPLLVDMPAGKNCRRHDVARVALQRAAEATLDRDLEVSTVSTYSWIGGSYCPVERRRGCAAPRPVASIATLVTQGQREVDPPVNVLRSGRNWVTVPAVIKCRDATPARMRRWRRIVTSPARTGGARGVRPPWRLAYRIRAVAHPMTPDGAGPRVGVVASVI